MEYPEHETPIYKKAEEINQLVFSFTEYVEFYDFPNTEDIEEDMRKDHIFSMQQHATELSIMVAEASRIGTEYNHAMENAVVVKYHTQQILMYANIFENTGLKDSDFIDLFHDTVEEFRVLFIEWIKTFNLWKYNDFEPSWNLFVPEGIVVVDYMTGDRYDEENQIDYDEDDDDDDEEYYEEDEDEEDEFDNDEDY